MDADLADQLSTLAAEWDRTAPPITVGELVTASGFAEETSPSPAVAVQHIERGHPWWWMGIAAAAIAVTLVVATVITRNEPQPGVVTPVNPTSPGTEAPSTTASPSTSTSPVTPEQMLDRMVGDVTAARAALDSFTAIVTVTTSNPGVDASGAALPPDVVTRTNTVTMRSDGSLWSEGELFVWSSFDPSTGTARNAILDADGSMRYQEVAGWSDATTPVNILFGVDPFADVYGITLLAGSPDVTQQIEEVTSHLGRTAWRIVQRSPAPSQAGADSINTSTSTWDIDRATGIVIAYSNTQSLGGVEQRTNSKVSELTLGTQLPAEFPGTFPDGAAVDRSGDPNGHVPVSLEQAANRFGRAIYVPTSFGDDAVVAITTQRSAFGNSVEPNATMVQVEVVQRIGFTTASITMFEFVPDPGAAVPPDMTLDDGLWCFAPPGMPCGGGATDTVITDGDLAGTPSALEGPLVSASLGGVNLLVRASTPMAALALANSLVRVNPMN